MPVSPAPGSEVSLDTNVISEIAHLTTAGLAYSEILEGVQTVVTFFVQAEVLANQWPPDVRDVADEILSVSTLLLSPSITTINDYVSLKRLSVMLGLRYGAEREDLWMLAQTRFEGFAVMTHDRAAARVAHAAGMEVYTVHEDLANDYERDRQRLRRIGML